MVVDLQNKLLGFERNRGQTTNFVHVHKAGTQYYEKFVENSRSETPLKTSNDRHAGATTILCCSDTRASSGVRLGIPKGKEDEKIDGLVMGSGVGKLLSASAEQQLLVFKLKGKQQKRRPLGQGQGMTRVGCRMGEQQRCKAREVSK